MSQSQRKLVIKVVSPSAVPWSLRLRLLLKLRLRVQKYQLVVQSSRLLTNDPRVVYRFTRKTPDSELSNIGPGGQIVKWILEERGEDYLVEAVILSGSRLYAQPTAGYPLSAIEPGVVDAMWQGFQSL